MIDKNSRNDIKFCITELKYQYFLYIYYDNNQSII